MGRRDMRHGKRTVTTSSRTFRAAGPRSLSSAHRLAPGDYTMTVTVHTDDGQSRTVRGRLTVTA
jgi:hypothetical protein